MDLIDREALIGVFAGLVPWAIDSFEDAAYARGLDAGYQALVAAPAVDVRPQWISVKDSPPKENVEVLIAFPCNMCVGFLEDGMWYVNSGDCWFTGVNEDDGDALPLYWMPLPEAPKEDCNG